MMSLQHFIKYCEFRLACLWLLCPVAAIASVLDFHSCADYADLTRFHGITRAPAVTEDIAIFSHYAAVLSKYRLSVWDLDGQNGPIEVTSTPVTGCEVVKVQGSYLYIGGVSGLSIFDVSNLPSLTNISGLSSIGHTFDVMIQGNRAFAATYAGIQVIDISNSYEPRAIKLITNKTDVVQRVVIIDDRLIGMKPRQIVVFDISNDNDIQLLNEFSVPLNKHQLICVAQEITTDSKLLYVSTSCGSLLMLDPVSGRLIDTMPVTACKDVVASAGRLCAVLDPQLGYISSHVFSLGTANDIIATDYISIPYDEYCAVDLNRERWCFAGRTLLASGRFGQTFQLSETNQLLGTNNPMALASDGDLLYVADYTGGLKCYTTGKAVVPTLTDSIRISDATFTDVKISDQIAYVLDKKRGLFIIDSVNPYDLRIIGNLGLNEPLAIQITDTHAYVACRKELVVIDISDHARPLVVGRASNLGGNDLALVGNRLYIAGTNSIEVVDISDSGTLHSLKTDSRFSQACLAYDEIQHRLIAVTPSHVGVFDLSESVDLNVFVIEDTHMYGMYPQHITAHNGVVYASCSVLGLVVFVVADDGQARMHGGATTIGSVRCTLQSDTQLFIANSDGLYVTKTQCADIK